MFGKGFYDPINRKLYNLINTIGIGLAIVCAALLIFFEWKRRKDADEPLKESEKPFNYWFFALCYAVAYAALVVGTGKIGGLISIDRGGNVFVGGVLTFIPVFLVLAMFFPQNGRPTEQLELVLPSLALNHCVSRIACLFNGCCFGVPFEPGLTYPDYSTASMMFDSQPLFPTQPVESTVMLLCFITILVLQAKGKRTLPVFPLVFSATGFLLTFVTGGLVDGDKTYFGLRAMQLHQIAYVLAFFVGIYLLLLVIREEKGKKEKMTAKKSAARSIPPQKKRAKR